MNFTEGKTEAFQKIANLRIIISFTILFSIYHLAEYAIVFRNSSLGFLGFQALFFIAAFFIGNWYKGNGLAAWSLPFRIRISHLLIGTLLGITVYAVPFFLGLALGIESVTEIPNFGVIINGSLPFAFGVLFSSFSEDILTRGLIFAHLKDKFPAKWLILISALVYLLNHIYRLTDGPETWLYLFLLGVIFMIPLVITKNIWLTGMMHWAGNLFFFVTHNVITTETRESFISSNYLFSGCLLLFIPVVCFVSKALRKTE